MSKELALLGADTANQQAGGPSFFDKAAMWGGSSVLSGLASIYNTGVEYANMAGASADMIDVSRVLETYDRDWYAYYKENKQLVDISGFVASSFIPGTLAIKGLKAVQAGHAGGAIGRAVAGPLNFFAGKRDAALEAGLKEIASEGGSAFAYLNSKKLASMGWGVADNVLQGAAAEMAVLMTMNQSPVLADASKGDILSDMAFGAFVGGGFGGAIDAIATNRIFKDAVKQLGSKQRGYDTPGYYNYGGLGVGDEAFGFIDSLLALPKSVLDDDKFFSVKNTLSGKTVKLDISKHLDEVRKDTQKDAWEQVQLTLQKISTKGTPEAAEAYSSMIVKMVRDGIAAGTPPAKIKSEVGGYLLGQKSVKTLTDDAPIDTKSKDEIFYIANSVDLAKLAAGGNDVDEFLKLATSRNPFAKNATAKPYKLVGDPANMRVTMSATLFNEAWEQGFDVAVIGGKMRVNPNSTIFTQVTDPVLVPQRYLNTRTTGVSDDVVATWADLLPAGAKASESILDDGVLYGKQALKLDDIVEPADAFTATAKHAWAASLGAKHFAGAVIDSADISRMERLIELGIAKLPDNTTSIKLPDGTTVKSSDVDLEQLLLQTKLSQMKLLMDEDIGRDMREVAYRINADHTWIERAIAEGYQPSMELRTGMSRNLSEYLQRENFVATWESPRSLVELGTVPKELLEATEAAATSKNAKYVDTFVTGELGFQQRVALANDLQKNAVHAVFGEEAKKFLDMDVRNVVKMADELGVGAGALSFSNAGYGDMLKLWAQHTGKLTHQLIQKVADANLEKIQPFIATFKDDKLAGAELGVIVSMLRRSADKFVLITNARGKQSLVVRDVTKVDPGTGQRYIDSGKVSEWSLQNAGKQSSFDIESDKVVSFLETWKDINADRIAKRTVLMNSRGKTLGWDPDVIYAPPIDTQKFPFFAFVKIRDGHIASTSDVGMITARSAEELSKLTKELPENYEYFLKKDTEDYFRVKNMYESQMSLNEPRVDSMLRKTGKLGDFFYEVRPENVMEDFIRYSSAADSALVRHGVDTRYAQLITELNALGKQYTEVATSQMSTLQKAYDRTVVNPFGDYVRTALDISKRSSFPLVQQMNEFVDSLGTAAYRALVANTQKAKDGTISWQEAEKIATRYGIGGAYTPENAEAAFAVANRPGDRNIIREAVSKTNMFLATVGLRLDVANSLVNVISMPIMLGTELASLKTLAKKDPEALGALKHLTSINPDGTVDVPGYTKLIGNAINNLMGKDGKQLYEKYRSHGDVKDVAMQFYDMLGELAINPKLKATEWSKKVDNAVEVASKWTGNTFSEDFTRALSANVMDQLTAPLVAKNLLTSQEADAYRSVFVNRVNGNYIASQRPILFQGTVGAAVSLFQTYMFNVMQQLTRHLENRDARALMTMAGLQGGLYGLNGIPFFDAVNTHLIGNANINDGHRDIYTTTTQLAGKELGDWLLYGTASALPLFGDKSPALYTRGDINPRHITVLPVSPLDVPAVDVSIRVAKNLMDVGRKLVGGADISASLLEGLEHNGVSRPLAGIAQLAQGYTSTSKGTLVSASNEFNGIVMGSRMLGARPMDEAVALHTMYRQQAYKAADLDRLSRLGEIVKTKLRAGQMPEAEELQDFMRRYASAGGNIQNYSSALQRWSRDANMSVVNQMKMHHQNSYSQRLAEIMSGTSLEDFASAPVQPPAQQLQ